MKRKVLYSFILLLAFTILLTTTVKAALQSNTNTQYVTKYMPADWMTNIRNMETTGGAMGLTETINASTKLATSESNNIDVHLLRSTEYGAVTLLSISEYGNPQTIQASTIKTTTGNKSGVYFSATGYEWIAGGLSGVFSGVNTRYYDLYTALNTTAAKAGDAIGDVNSVNKGTSGWHSASTLSGGYSTSYFKRGGSGLFTIYYNGYSSTGKYEYARAAVVNGNGF